MITHTVHCSCGHHLEVDGWLDAQELRRLHNRQPGHDAVVDLYLGQKK